MTVAAKPLQACIIRAELKGMVQEVGAERLEAAVDHRQQFKKMSVSISSWEAEFLNKFSCLPG